MAELAEAVQRDLEKLRMCDSRNPMEFKEVSANSLLWCGMASFCLHNSPAGKDLGFAVRLQHSWRVVIAPFLLSDSKSAPEVLSHLGPAVQ